MSDKTATTVEYAVQSRLVGRESWSLHSIWRTSELAAAEAAEKNARYQKIEHRAVQRHKGIATAWEPLR